MLLLEARDEGKRLTHDFKMAVISANPATYIPVVFPEWQDKEEPKKVITEITDEDLTDSGGEWTFTDSEVDLERADALFEQTLAQMQGRQTITERDLSEIDDW